MTRYSLVLIACGLSLLSACVDLYDPTPRPDYRVTVVPTPQGSLALPPPCPSWSTATTDPYDNQPVPQFGCANARNLAAMVENPDDLIQGRPLGPARGVTSVGAIRRYDNNQTRGLIVPGAETNQTAATTSSNGASSMTGDVTGAASATSTSSSSTASP